MKRGYELPSLERLKQSQKDREAKDGTDNKGSEERLSPEQNEEEERVVSPLLFSDEDDDEGDSVESIMASYKEQMDIIEGSSQSTSFGAPSKTNISVSLRQKGNPVLPHLKSVAWEYADIVPDFILGPTVCAIFISLRYHNLHPSYIHERLKALANRGGTVFGVRVLLALADTKYPEPSLKDLNKICLYAGCSFIVSFSADEAARYLEAYKVFESKPREALMQRADELDLLAVATECLTAIKGVNKTDARVLLQRFGGTVAGVLGASVTDLAKCPGIGPVKAKRMVKAFNEPFKVQ